MQSNDQTLKAFINNIFKVENAPREKLLDYYNEQIKIVYLGEEITLDTSPDNLAHLKTLVLHALLNS